MADSLLSPLQHNVEIAFKDGTPTPYFIEWLQQLRAEKAITDGLAAAAAPQGLITASGLTLPSATIAGNKEVATGPVEALTLSQVLDLIGGAAQGDILFRNAAGWSRLGAGANNAILKTAGVGANPSWATISAVLDSISNVRGSILYRGAVGWVSLAPGTAGFLLQTNGAGADPSWVTAPAGGGGGATGELPLVLPNVANFTYNGNASGSMASTSVGMKVVAPNNGTQYFAKAIQNGALPAFPFSITMRARGFVGGPQTGGNPCALILRNSTNGRMLILCDNTGTTAWNWQRWNSDSSFNATINSFNYGCSPPFFWKRLSCSSTGASPQVSPDGVNWDSAGAATENYSTFLTAAGGAFDQIGFGAGTGNGQWNYTACSHWSIP